MFTDLVEELIAVFRAGVAGPLPDHHFNELALRVFRYQCRVNSVYKSFAHGRGVTEMGIERWEMIPPVPAAAFKELALVSGDPADVQKVFRTSGTTLGGGRRGEHHVLDLRIYHAALEPNFQAHVLPDEARLPMLSLIPSPEELPDSSLSHMVGRVMSRMAAAGSGYFVGPDAGMRGAELAESLNGFQDRGKPVLLLGAAFAFVHWLDEMAEQGREFALPAGSRIMETGGFKGRSRVMPRSELYGALHDRLGVPPDHIVNEYGMTELLSQFYEPVLVKGFDGFRRHAPPPWVRTRVLDPVSLEPLPDGIEGLLCHLDLANLGSVSCVLTEDIGTAVEGGFQVSGRVQGAEPRGCSLAMDDLLSAVERGS